MSCSYYEFRQGSFYCHRKGDYVNSDAYYRYCRDYNYSECSIYKNHDRFDSACYLSSACIISRGLPDDCVELKILRSYRDDWLKNQPMGEKAIEYYYKVAPKIVSSVNDRNDSKEIYNNLYEEMIVPCITLICKGHMHEAYDLYSEFTNKLVEAYL